MNKRLRKRLLVRVTGSINGRWGRIKRVRVTTNMKSASLSLGGYIGPSVDGGDKEYYKVMCGKVTDRKPSFIQ